MKMAMLGQLVRDCIEEVAFSGPPGICYSEVVEYVRKRHTGTIDKAVLDPCWQALRGRREVTLWLNGKKQARKEFDYDAAMANKNLLIEVTNEFRNHILQLSPFPQLCGSLNLCKIAWAVSKRRHEGFWSFELGTIFNNKTTKDVYHQMQRLVAGGVICSILATVPEDVKERCFPSYKPGDKRGKHKKDGVTVPQHANVLFLRRFMNDFDQMSEDICQIVCSTHVSSLAANLFQVIESSGGIALEKDCRAVIDRSLLNTTGTVSKKARVSGKLYRRVRKFLIENKKIEVCSVPNSGKLERAICTTSFTGDRGEVHFSFFTLP